MANSDEHLNKYNLNEAISFLKENHQCKSLDILLWSYYTEKEASKYVSEDNQELRTKLALLSALFQKSTELTKDKEVK